MGHYDAQIRKMSAALHSRRNAMQEAIETFGLDIAGQGAFGGSSYWMRAPQGVDTRVLAQQLQEVGVLIEPGHAFFSGDDQPQRFYRLGYSSIQADRIHDGIGLIARHLQ